MSRNEKLLLAMRNNPRDDWSIEQFKALARQLGIRWRQPGTSHVTFVAPDGESLTVPSHKPIKPIYVRRFLALIGKQEEDNA
ncbi:MAG: addiction module toxin, HicA family [Deltaproteobacteria bacterium]|nr:addiction module toxin, HicA family [Deltaproteobacteria bacterium]